MSSSVVARGARGRRWKRGTGAASGGAAVDSARALGEEALQAAPAGVLGPAASSRYAHAHLGVAGLHAELGEEPEQQGVGALVVDDEAGVDAQVAVAARHVVGVRVPAEPRLGLEEGDVVASGEHVGGRQPGDAGADHGDPLRAARGGTWVE